MYFYIFLFSWSVVLAGGFVAHCMGYTTTYGKNNFYLIIILVFPNNMFIFQTLSIFFYLFNLYRSSLSYFKVPTNCVTCKGKILIILTNKYIPFRLPLSERLNILKLSYADVTNIFKLWSGSLSTNIKVKNNIIFIYLFILLDIHHENQRC